MRISFTNEIDGGQIVYPIGRIRAASGWRASTTSPADESAKDVALRALIQQATEFEADAIIGVDFEIDGASHLDLANVYLKRVAATGIAVRLAKAA